MFRTTRVSLVLIIDRAYVVHTRVSDRHSNVPTSKTQRASVLERDRCNNDSSQTNTWYSIVKTSTNTLTFNTELFSKTIKRAEKCMRNRNKLSDSFRRLCHLIHFYLLHFALAIIVSHKIDVLQTPFKREVFAFKCLWSNKIPLWSCLILESYNFYKSDWLLNDTCPFLEMILKKLTVSLWIWKVKSNNSSRIN